jgi:hypothetical protein
MGARDDHVVAPGEFHDLEIILLGRPEPAREFLRREKFVEIETPGIVQALQEVGEFLPIPKRQGYGEVQSA